MMNKAEKQFANEKKIATTIVEIRSQREDLEDLVKEYDDAAYEAAKLGQDAYANELIESSCDLSEFTDDLKYLELQIKNTAVTARVLGNLGKLPAALAACRKVFAKAPNFRSLGKEMNDFRDTLKKARGQVSDLRANLSKESDPVYAEVFGKRAKAVVDPKHAQRVSDKKKALEARLARESVAPVAPVSAAASVEVSASDDARIDAIASMLDDERSK
jgi:hypothetical protein